MSKQKFFKSLFDINLVPQLSKLIINVRSDYDLPVLVNVKRNRGETVIKESIESRYEFKPLMFDQKYSIIDGGNIRYSLRFSDAPNFRTYNYQTELGIHLLGGNFSLHSSGSYLEQQDRFLYYNTPRWNFGITENKLISNITLGKLYIMNNRFQNLQSNNIIGLQITNEKKSNR